MEAEFEPQLKGVARYRPVLAALGMIYFSAMTVAAALGIVALYSYAVHVCRQDWETSPSALSSTFIGTTFIALVFVGAYVSRKMPWRITVDDQEHFGFAFRAVAVLIGWPSAALFGFLLWFIVLIASEHLEMNVAPMRAFMNGPTSLILIVVSGGYLLFAALIHAGLRFFRSSYRSIFLSTMLTTGVAMIFVMFAFLLLFGVKSG